MKKVILFFVMTLIVVTGVFAQVSEEEYKALQALYNELGGKEWVNNKGWDFTAGAANVKNYKKETGEGWYGITLDTSKGHVSKVELINNNLKGKLPNAICEFVWARTINLSENKITGSLPAGISKLGKISNFDLSNNQLTGEIPSEITEMGKDAFSRSSIDDKNGTEIKVHLSNNNFTGSIPENIGDMALLNKPAKSISLNLSSNQLTGEIPKSILKLNELTYLRLMNNQLTGIVPEGLGSLPKLKVLRLDKNKLTGKVPMKK